MWNLCGSHLVATSVLDATSSSSFSSFLSPSHCRIFSQHSRHQPFFPMPRRRLPCLIGVRFGHPHPPPSRHHFSLPFLKKFHPTTPKKQPQKAIAAATVAPPSRTANHPLDDRRTSRCSPTRFGGWNAQIGHHNQPRKAPKSTIIDAAMVPALPPHNRRPSPDPSPSPLAFPDAERAENASQPTRKHDTRPLDPPPLKPKSSCSSAATTLPTPFLPSPAPPLQICWADFLKHRRKKPR